jgi:hypothetical protein
MIQFFFFKVKAKLIFLAVCVISHVSETETEHQKQNAFYKQKIIESGCIMVL